MGGGWGGVSDQGRGHCLGASRERRPQLGHREPQKLSQESLGISPRAHGSFGRRLSRGGLPLEAIRARQLGGQR